MPSKGHVKSLIVNYIRRLEKLKEQQALFGLSTPPAILVEIEDTETKIEELQTELKKLVETEIPKAFDGYKVVTELGLGTFGIVYLVEDIRLGQKLALKHFTPNRFDENLRQEAYQRFKRGVRIMSDHSHPGIVRIHKVIAESLDRCYHTMDYYPLGNLQRFLQKVRRREIDLSLDDKIDIVLSVCESVAYAHSQGIVHRDIKPTNILIDQAESGNFFPKLADFDLAFQRGETGLTDGPIGSLYFLPPEIRSDLGRQDDETLLNVVPALRERAEKVDIYAVGGILYFVLTQNYPPLHSPFVEIDIAFKRVVEKEIFEERDKLLLEALKQVVYRVLDSKEVNRPQSIDQLRELIQETYANPNAHLTKFHKSTSIEDVSELVKDALESFLTAPENLIQILELMPLPVTILQDGFVRYANIATSSLLEMNREKLLNVTVDSCFRVETASTKIPLTSITTNLSSITVKELGLPVEAQILSPTLQNGKFCNLYGSLVHFQDRPALVLIFDDITQRKRIEEQLRQAQKMEAIGRLTGGIAHDFNNLLTVITGVAEILKSDLSPNVRQYELASQILEAGNRAAILTRQLLTFSRKQIIEPRVMDLNSVVSQIDKMLRRVIGEDIQMEIILAPNLWSVKVDPAQIEQVIVNLVVNARDAMPNGGKLTIETLNIDLERTPASTTENLEPGSHVILKVSDTGVGIHEAILPHIFEPFFTTKEAGKGTGLGLSTVYGIITQSGGAIRVYSELGMGTTFEVYLPGIKKVNESQNLPSAKDEDKQITETILVVEDEPRVRSLICRILQGQGYVVLEAGDGEEALKICKKMKDPIHLVVTDIVMPRMGGFELVQRVAKLRPAIKTLYISGYKNHEIMMESEVAFLGKPLSPATLTNKVREVLDEL